MRKRLALYPLARQELLNSVKWYDDHSLLAGDRLLEETNTGFQKIAENPQAFSFTSLGTRAYRLPSFPYLIHYQERTRLIVIFAIYHEKRDIKKLRNRIP